MAKLILPLVVGILLFAGSAALSHFLLPKPEAAAEESDPGTEPMVNSASANLPDPSMDNSTEQILPFEPHGMTTETVLRLSESVREQERLLDQWRKDLETKEDRLTLLMDDIKREKTEILDLQQTIEDGINEAAVLMNEFSSANPSSPVPDGSTADPASPVSAASPPTPQQLENMTTIANWLESMPPELAAESIRQFSNDGQMEMAVGLLHQMEQRNAAKILAALQDAVLFSQIAKRYRELNTSEIDGNAEDRE